MSAWVKSPRRNSPGQALRKREVLIFTGGTYVAPKTGRPKGKAAVKAAKKARRAARGVA